MAFLSRFVRSRMALLIVAVVVTGSAATALAAGETPTQINACVSLRNGAVRIVDADATCGKGERKESWDKTGREGEQGPVGPAGPAGLDGADGQDGADGTPGSDGPSGPQGPQGPQGLQGLLGPIGPQGADGDVGAVGPAGPAGAAGPKGDTGAVGPIGPSGAAGADGAIGPQGPQGEIGPAGADADDLVGSPCELGGETSTVQMYVNPTSGVITLGCGDEVSPLERAKLMFEPVTYPCGFVGTCWGRVTGFNLKPSTGVMLLRGVPFGCTTAACATVTEAPAQVGSTSSDGTFWADLNIECRGDATLTATVYSLSGSTNTSFLSNTVTEPAACLSSGGSGGFLNE